jgi:hypothetical protein
MRLFALYGMTHGEIPDFHRIPAEVIKGVVDVSAGDAA